jgi:hypothetical protein
MKKGDVAISHLIGIALGLIVLGIIIYFLYLNITNSQIDCQRCSVELSSWCAKCHMHNWDSAEGTIKSDYLEDCIGKCVSDPVPDDCDAAAFCKGYIPSI